MPEFKEMLADRVKETEEIIKRYLPEEAGFQRTIMKAMNYSMNAGGKRIRPLLMLETGRLFGFGGARKELEHFMAAIEMIHTSSLIHDDLPCMDNDEYRRGKKSTWAAFGEDMGVLAGDALIVEAFSVASDAFSGTEHPYRVGQAVRILAEKTGIYGMIGGQVVDVELTNQPVPADKLDFIYRLKTGALLEASMLIGAVLAGAEEEDCGMISRIALNVGLAFQIQDDILDVMGDPELLGKPVGSDERNAKTTFVTLKGLDEAREEVKRLSEEAISQLHSLNREDTFLEQLIRMLITREK